MALTVAIIIFSSLDHKQKNKDKFTISRSTVYLIPLFMVLVIIAFGSSLNSNLIEKKLELVGDGNNYSIQTPIENSKAIPLLVYLNPNNPKVSLSDSYFILNPGEIKEIEIKSDIQKVTITMGSFYPILPDKLFYKVFIWNQTAASFIIVSVLIVPITTIAFLLLLWSVPKQKKIKNRRKRTYAWDNSG